MGAPMVVDVLANDAATNGALRPWTVAVVGPPAHGTFEIDVVTGKITYTPDPGYNGPDSLEYTVCDDAACGTATLTFTVLAPVIVPTPSASSGSGGVEDANAGSGQLPETSTVDRTSAPGSAGLVATLLLLIALCSTMFVLSHPNLGRNGRI